jgi:hypothetical protein
VPFLLGMAVLVVHPKNCVETDTPLCLDAPEDAAFIPIHSHIEPVSPLFTPRGRAVTGLLTINATAVGLPV